MLLLLVQGSSAADQGILRQGCAACHAADVRVVGPAFREVAARYRGVEAAEARLARSIREGSNGIWGKVAMPAAPQIGEVDARKLARWVLAQ